MNIIISHCVEEHIGDATSEEYIVALDLIYRLIPGPQRQIYVPLLLKEELSSSLMDQIHSLAYNADEVSTGCLDIVLHWDFELGFKFSKTRMLRRYNKGDIELAETEGLSSTQNHL
jgi:hypothetical protein